MVKLSSDPAVDLVGSEAANAVASKQLVGRYAPVEKKDSSIISGI